MSAGLQQHDAQPPNGCVHPAGSALPWLKRPSDLGMWWAFWEGKYSLWQVIKIPAGWMAMNEEIGNSMVGWINSANPESCELEGSIWFPALGGWPNLENNAISLT